jgi:hypothetical protein
MVFWSDINVDNIETVPGPRDKTKFRYNDGPLRFQIPRAWSNFGVSAYKSINLEVKNGAFSEWWRALEKSLCPREPFNSNLKMGSLRLKVDDSAYVFDENSKQICPEIKEGLFRGQEVSCMIDIDSTYFFNGNWGLTIRLYQIKTLTAPPTECDGPDEPSVLAQGICAFLPEAA